jgi:hypothetical protein
MTIHTPSDRVLTKPSVNIAITAATTHGSAVDTLYARTALAICYALPTGTGTTLAGYVEECATSGGSYVKVTGSDFVTATTVGGAQISLVNIDLSKRLRYLKVVLTGAGGSAAGQAVGMIQLFSEGRQPVSQDVTPVTVPN